MFSINVMAWNGGDLEKLEVLLNRVKLLVLGMKQNILSFIFAIGIAISAVLLQQYSPSSLDRVLSDPRVQLFVTKSNVFFKDIREKIKTNGYPIWKNIHATVAPYFKILSEQSDKTISGSTVKEAKSGKADGIKESVERIFTDEELKEYSGKPGSKGLYLAFLGKVYDVKKGEKFYGPGGGYEFFAGRDASRAFVTGNFEDAGLTDDIKGLSSQDLLGIKTWSTFYDSDYPYMGKLAGRYYTATGAETQYKLDVDRWLEEARLNKEKDDDAYKIFPPCNTEWNQDRGSRVWCTRKSGGVERSWVGVPRKLYMTGKSKPRCACVKNTGEPLSLEGSAGASKKGHGDLNNPNLKEYPGCSPTANECLIPKEN
ncbi:Cytochrome b5-like heme/steroid binding domain [Trinorchestia longiramus]|nr:Cytochrome b5-like heme/steroid binding domain [Trinorchestia longiramus]